MIEKVLNIWDRFGKEPICITTNGFVKKNGEAVCGKGVAKQACGRIEGFAKLLGTFIQNYGNVVGIVPPEGLSGKLAHWAFSFPVKPKFGVCAKDGRNVVKHMREKFVPGDLVPGWAMQAQIETIERSLYELATFADGLLKRDSFFVGKIYLPRPGCGAGGLDWEVVKPLCGKYGDWLVVVDRE